LCVATGGRREFLGWIFHSGITFGTKEKNISAGIFVGSFDKYSPPFKGVMLHGQVRLGRKTWLISENHLVLRPRSVMPVCLWGFRKKMRPLTIELGLGWTKTRRTGTEFAHVKSRYIAFPWFGAVFGMPKKI